MKQSILQSIGLTFIFYLLIFSGCSTVYECPETSTIGPITIDPTGSPCTKLCECNNMKFTGICKKANESDTQGVCESQERGVCSVPGEQQSCTLNPNMVTAGQCQQGLRTCGENVSDGRWGDCRAITPSEAENTQAMCGDGIDNDCDGKADKADPECAAFCNPGKTETCFKDSKLEPKNEGICKLGFRVCNENGEWGDCIGSVEPKEKETCNGLDDDCNGKVDDGLTDCEGCQPPGKREICFGTGTSKQAGVGICKSGLRTCLGDGEWGACENAVGPEKEICNGFDDDCNGKVDDGLKDCEGCQPPGKRDICFGKGSAKQAGVGICKSGFRVCLSNGEWGSCEGHIDPKDKETCNGLDDNCDGQVDEGLTDCNGCQPPGAQQNCFAGTPTQQGVGICKAGSQICQADGTWSTCEGAINPKSAEECNGLDDDCNGKVDDGLTNCNGCQPPGLRQTCFDGTSSQQNVGICKAGSQICQANGTWSTCEGQTKPATETCNGLDDDCDGTVDDGLTNCNGCQPPGLLRVCYSGDTSKMNVGTCEEGFQTCQADGTWSGCKGEVLPEATERCDLLDNDCNGFVDDGGVQGGKTLDLTRKCYTGKSGCDLTTGKCTTNSPCALGTQTCSNGQWGTCENQVTPATEVCNGTDDDCDGQVDESDPNPPPCRNQKNQCKGSTTPISKCVDGRWRQCDEQDYKSHYSNYNRTETCDQEDNNCDGQIDDGVKDCIGITAGRQSLSYRDGSGSIARFSGIAGLAVYNGDLFVADGNNYRIRRIDPCGNVTTYAGSGVSGRVEGVGLNSTFGSPGRMDVDTSGNLFFIDTTYSTIWRIGRSSKQAIVIAGSGLPLGGLIDGPGNQANFVEPRSIAVTGDGKTLFVGERNGRIRKVEQVINKPCGKVPSYTGFCVTTLVDLKAPNQSHIMGLALDQKARKLYSVLNSNQTIYQTDLSVPTSTTTVFVKIPASTLKGLTFSKSNTPSENALLTIESGVALWSVNLLTKRPLSIVRTDAGETAISGKIVQAKFPSSDDLCADIGENIYYATGGMILRLQDKAPPGYPQCVITIAGDGNKGFKDGDKTASQFTSPSYMTSDSQGQIYVSDTQNKSIRKIDLDGKVTTYSGNIIPGYRDGPIQTALFNDPMGLAHDSKNNLYIVDASNLRIRKISYVDGEQCGLVSNYQGLCVSTFAGTGVPNTPLGAPKDLVVDGKDTLYVSDTKLNKIFSIAPDGKISTFIGTGTKGSLDGPASSATLTSVQHMTMAPDGKTLFFVDKSALRMAQPVKNQKCGTTNSYTGYCVTTLAGSVTQQGNVLGIPSQARFQTLAGVSVDDLGNVYLTGAQGTDHYLYVIRNIKNGKCGTQTNYTGRCVEALNKGGSGSLDTTVNNAKFSKLSGLHINRWGDIYISQQSRPAIRMIPWKK
ncbi:MAG: hypothetical protein CL920_34600 [Deltaproteobacteria bacterium]|nr:hypothetical protein [Deltaproteobacteria bacterium]MBU53856.1 hypothetical protein [Deltaproteobacteria bacterium]